MFETLHIHMDNVIDCLLTSVLPLVFNLHYGFGYLYPLITSSGYLGLAFTVRLWPRPRHIFGVNTLNENYTS